MTWLTYLLSAVFALTTPTHASATTKWTVIVGGATADTSISVSYTHLTLPTIYSV